MAANKVIHNFTLEHNNVIYGGFLKGKDYRQADNKGFSKLIKNLGDTYVLGENITYINNILDLGNY
jgi:hypothetical protein